MLNEEGEPTNSVSAGSMDHHDASDGKRKKEKTKIVTRKKKTFKEYVEDEYDTAESDGWYDLEFDDEILLRSHIINLEIPAEDYEIYNDGIAQFKYEKDIEAVEDLLYPEDDGYGEDDDNEPFHTYYDLP